MPLFPLANVGGSGGSIAGLPDGFVVSSGGVLSTVEMRSGWPIRLENGDAKDNPWFGFSGHHLGRLLDFDLASTADQVIPMGAASYIVRRIVIGLSSNTPAGAGGAIFTLPGGGGESVVALPAAGLSAALTSYKGVWVSPDITPVMRAAPYLYLRLSTASTAPAKASVFVIGDVLIGSDDRDMGA